ncbi:MAG: SIMPL domain-containing protein [Rickettsiales bacterium]|jgi:uncharacterized protein YggE|nr:SIMPL domain-containing protein [Rickettsiales bacterium]
MIFKNVNANAIVASAVVLLSVLVLKYGRAPDGPGQINVSGECLRRVEKDRSSIVLEVRNLEPDASTSLKKSMATYAKISDYVSAVAGRSKGTELETTAFESEEKKEWNKKLGKYVTLGIESKIGLEITTPDPTLVGGILAEVSKYRDVYADGFGTFASRELMKREHEACIAEATKNARDKASAMAAAAGGRVGKMLSANFYQSPAPGGGRRMYKAARSMNMEFDADGAADSAPAIFSKPSDISVTVNASFEIR